MNEFFFDRRGRRKYADDIIPVHKDGYFALLVKDGKFLLTYPPDVTIPEIPGGSIHRGETFRDCLFRKLYEETGIEFMLDWGQETFEQTFFYYADDEKPDGGFYVYHQTFVVYDASNYGFDTGKRLWRTPENGRAGWFDAEKVFSGEIEVNYGHRLALQALFSGEES